MFAGIVLTGVVSFVLGILFKKYALAEFTAVDTMRQQLQAHITAEVCALRQDLLRMVVRDKTEVVNLVEGAEKKL